MSDVTSYDKAKDIEEKMEIAKAVIMEAKLDHIFKMQVCKPIKETTFLEFYYYSRCSYKDDKCPLHFDIRKLRDMLNEAYLVKKIIPTARDILEPMTLDKLGKDCFFNCIPYCGYVWKQIPGTKKAIFVESSERLAGRIDYLRKMERYRTDGRIQHFVYIDIIDITGVPGNYRAVVSNKLGSLYDHTSKEDIYTWLQTFMYKIKEPTLFVYVNPGQKKISPFSTKAAMMKRLKDFGVPFNINSHRFELYDLVQRFAKNKEDEFAKHFKAFGHDAIERPLFFNVPNKKKENHDPLDFFQEFSQFKNDVKSKARFKFNGTEVWSDVEKELAAIEKEMLKQDLEMETVIDKIMTYGKYEGNAPEYLTDYSEVKKYDPEFGPMNAFVD